ncbi:MAG: DEAD/DEAH box helicase [Planctomycetota bacterium]|jgi:superfamily II DNA or RNA helicase
MLRVDSVIQKTKVQPRPYQRRIVTKTTQMFRGDYVDEHTGNGLDEPISSVMIESPTGSGKTVMALLAAKTLQQDDPDLVIGWVAMRRNLLVQAERENRKHGINLENAHWISMFDKSPDELIQARKDGKRILMIVDEAQHDAASSMSHLHNIIEPDMILGMTATPFRTDKMKLCFQKVIKDCGIHQLIQDGWLAPFHHYSIPQWDAATVADHYCADPERWGKSIFFFVNLEECHKLGREFELRGIDHEIVTGSSNRDAQLERFESGEINCLINCMVLTEGFDCPSLKTAWVRDSGKGPTMQMGGRAFRQHPDLQYKQIVQSKNTRWPLIKTAMPAEQYVWSRNQWMALKVNPHLNSINTAARRLIARTAVEMPKFVLSRKGRTKIRF